jgi:iron(III) transport system permease protein
VSAAADHPAPLPAPRPGTWWERAGIRLDGRSVAIAVIVAIVLYLVLGPVLMLLFSSFKETVGVLPFEADVPTSLENYVRVFLSTGTYAVLLTTLVYTAGSLLISFGLSITLAWLVERTDMPLRSLIFVMVVAALGLPGVIAGIAWVLLLSPRAGLINQFLRDTIGLEGTGPLDIYTLPGLIFVQGITLLPITFLLVTAAFAAADASVEEAGSTSGAPFRRVMRRISMPLLLPALLSALVYQFVSVIESFDVPLVIGLPAGIRVLSTEIYTWAAPSGGLPNYGLSSTYAVLLIGLSIAPLLLYNRVISRSDRYAVVSGHSRRSRRVGLGRWRWPMFILCLAVVIVAFVMPTAVMVWTSVQPFYALPSPESIARITLRGYETILGRSSFHQVVINTLLMAGATALATMTIGLLVSWVLVRTRSRLRFPLDVLAFTPHAMPGVIIGLSVLLIYLLLPVPLYGTIWIMVVALTTQWLSLSSRLMTGGIAQIQRQLEEAATTSGASWFRTMWRVVLPLVMPAFLNGLVLIFLLGIKNLTIPLILFTPKTQVLSTTVWQLWENGDTAATAAVGVIMVSITLTLALLLRRLNASTYVNTT